MKFERGLQRAATLEQTIRAFSNEDSIPSLLGHRDNVVERLEKTIREVAESYKGAFDIYIKLWRTDDTFKRQQVESKIVELLTLLFAQLERGFWASSIFKLEVLLGVEKYSTVLEGIVPGTRKRIRQFIYIGIHHKLLQNTWTHLPLLLEAVKALRKSSEDEAATQEKYNRDLCNLLELIAQTCITDAAFVDNATDQQADLANAINAYETGAAIAQSIDIQWAAYFSKQASRLLSVLSSLPPEPIFADPLGSAIAASTARQHSERLLPDIKALISEYAALSDKLSYLVNDTRFHLDDNLITKWTKLRPNTGLKEWVTNSNEAESGAKTLDKYYNSVGVTSLVDEFRIHFIAEVEQSIKVLFQEWINSGQLQETQVRNYLNQYWSDYPWEIVEIALSEYFKQRNFVSAAHLLIPQLENVIREVGRFHDIDKKTRKGETGELYLSDLVQSTKIQRILGAEFVKIIFWYMVNREAVRFNVRNNVVHGLSKISDYDWEAVASMTMWMLLKVVHRGTKVDKDSD